MATHRALLLHCTDGLRARFLSLPLIILISLLALRLCVAYTRKKVQELLLYFIRHLAQSVVLFSTTFLCDILIASTGSTRNKKSR